MRLANHCHCYHDHSLFIIDKTGKRGGQQDIQDALNEDEWLAKYQLKSDMLIDLSLIVLLFFYRLVIILNQSAHCQHQKQTCEKEIKSRVGENEKNKSTEI